MIILANTKEKIFDAAVEIISYLGFEKADMRSIAAKSNIKAGSIYNHFASKIEILDLIYDYYLQHFFDNQVPIKTIESVMQTGTREEIIDKLVFTFENNDQKKYQRMILISKIIYMRLFQDEKAKIIFREVTSKSISYIEELLNYGIKIKRLAKFDTKTYATLFVSSRHIMGITAFTETDYIITQLPDEESLNKLFAQTLPLL